MIDGTMQNPLFGTTRYKNKTPFGGLVSMKSDAFLAGVAAGRGMRHAYSRIITFMGVHGRWEKLGVGIAALYMGYAVLSGNSPDLCYFC
jgi:hypothetical protein